MDPALLERFVTVRLVQAWGVDLDILPSDPRSTLACVFMNADGAVYGRFSARQAGDLPALAKAVEGALALHAKWPSNRAELEGKRAPGLPWRRTSDVPDLRDKFGPAGLRGSGCLHCHHVRDGVVRSLEREKRPVPERLSTPWPAPERLGMSLLPGILVGEVQTGGPADLAGLKAGERIARLGGQPLLSIADVEWALFVAPDEGELAAEAGGRTLKIRLKKGWRNP